ncbi:hypothetical protein A6U86_34040 [Rhizobium sp. AC27/96]|uniref:response regulator transcription factor n=1 Tax=Rhizobium TaxID=379 RepID=UPI0008277ECD|nr:MULTISPECIES: LuxR C-terminal-related transcriptional regulator [Rhizobium]NTF46654.1 LuxR family transcriptional regulator [Rhizobium rhizogenes]OCI96586.1 hypothetical protein A6U86_34040 [Rhizobium sp. AC27/96]
MATAYGGRTRKIIALAEFTDDQELLKLRRQLPEVVLFELGENVDGLTVLRQIMTTLRKQDAGCVEIPPLAMPLMTRRQWQILQLIAQGQTNKEIARLLKLSPFTVRNHISLLFRILNATTREEAAAALQSGKGPF